MRDLTLDNYPNGNVTLLDVLQRECLGLTQLTALNTLEGEALKARLIQQPEKVLFILDGYDELNVEALAAPYQDPDYPQVKLLPVWHGTHPDALDTILKTGYANLAETDSGYFGKGLYGAIEAEYSQRVYSKGALLVNWVAFYLAYPVIGGDMPKLTGKGNYGNYDAHFIPVVPKNSKDPNEDVYIPCNPKQPHVYQELVTFESLSCLPRYVVQVRKTQIFSSLGGLGQQPPASQNTSVANSSNSQASPKGKKKLGF